MNEALCAENCVGRWIWKSGDLQGQGFVPWEVQAINTCPDNFLWEKNKSALVLAAPGLYHISFGFYSKRQPVIQVLVNNESILSVTPGENANSSNVISTAGKHSAGNITGVTLNEFVALPARARISLIYDSSTSGEGFF